MNQNKRKAEIELQLKKISDREKQLKAQMRAIDAREKEAARKKETRAKIILGGFLVAHFKHGDKRFEGLFDEAIDQANERDRPVLIDFKNRLSI